MSSSKPPEDDDSDHNQSKHSLLKKNENRKNRLQYTKAVVNQYELSGNHQQLNRCSDDSGSGRVMVPSNNVVEKTSATAVTTPDTTADTTAISVAIVRKRSKSETESKDVNNAKTCVSIGIDCQIGSDFDNEVRKHLLMADLNDPKTQELYNELLIQKQEQEITLCSLSEQLNTELTLLEMAKTLLSNVESDFERKIKETKLKNWCSNCLTEIRETDRIFNCCYGVLYCTRMCQLIDWRNGHRINCANNK